VIGDVCSAVYESICVIGDVCFAVYESICEMGVLFCCLRQICVMGCALLSTRVFV